MRKRLAICTGLTRVNPDAYDGWDGLCPGCDRDAALFATLCHDAGFDGVQVMINQMVDDRFIKPAFLQAASLLQAGDLLVLYFSGHGGQQPDVNGDETDGQDETLCWYNGEINDDVIADYLSLLPAGLQVLFVTDSCNSGSNFRGARRTRSTPVTLSYRATAKFEGTLLHLGGCADGRYSYGDEDGGDFTLALSDALRRARKPLTYDQWFQRAASRMPRRQHPVIEQWGAAPFAKSHALA